MIGFVRSKTEPVELSTSNSMCKAKKILIAKCCGPDGDRVSRRVDLEPELDQAADGFRPEGCR
jgi:hypothetical protein